MKILARLALLVAVLCAAAIALSGPGYRIGWWPLPVAFTLLRMPVWIAIGAMVVALGLAILTRPGTNRPGFAIALASLAIGAAAITGPLLLQARAKGVPPIHDITTDTAQPPVFVAVLPLRAGAANPAAYGGQELARAQESAYPRIVPLDLPAAPAAAFEKALALVKDSGWELVAAEPGEGRIEATATTPFFGFKDDVVLRIAARGTGSRVDMRSVSRIGRSDLGTNARRIEDFLARLAKAG
jgi:uncharacterized protein (DUF1499 family)